MYWYLFPLYFYIGLETDVKKSKRNQSQLSNKREKKKVPQNQG